MQYKTLGNTGLLVSTICFGTMTFHGERLSENAASGRRSATSTRPAPTSSSKPPSTPASTSSTPPTSTPRARARRPSASRSRTSTSPAKTSSSPPRSSAAPAPAATTSAPPAATSWTPSKPASAASRPTTSTSTRSTATTSSRPSKRPSAPSTPSSQQGKVRYIGVSNWQAWKIAKALGISEFKNLARFDTLQAYYSIAGRDLEREIVPLLEAEKTGLLVWSPLAGGLLSGKFSRENQKPEGSRRSEFDFPIVDKERTWSILDVHRPHREGPRLPRPPASPSPGCWPSPSSPPSSSEPSASTSSTTTSPPSTSSSPPTSSSSSTKSARCRPSTPAGCCPSRAPTASPTSRVLPHYPSKIY